MKLFPELKTVQRNTISEPKAANLFKGLAWIAAGLIGISFIATSVTSMWKIILCFLGILFLGIGGKLFVKYVLEYKAFQQYVPAWDSNRGMYDKFAQELNAWQKDDIVPRAVMGIPYTS